MRKTVPSELNVRRLKPQDCTEVAMSITNASVAFL